MLSSIIGCSTATFRKAEQLANKGLDTSAIDSDTEVEEVSKKRRIQKPKRLVADDERDVNSSSDICDSPLRKSPVRFTASRSESTGDEATRPISRLVKLGSVVDGVTGVLAKRTLSGGNKTGGGSATWIESLKSGNNDPGVTPTSGKGSAGPSIPTSTSGVQMLYYSKNYKCHNLYLL